ncbi:MAG: carbohydrate-binding family 9-like protein [Pyrinomonadaceae bacterium]
MTIDLSRPLSIAHFHGDIEIDDLSSSEWNKAETVSVTKYWSGETAPAGRHFTARLLWSDKYIYARFDASQAEPLVVAQEPDLTQKTIGLWDRDVCEIFLAPNADEPRRYFEFEVAPTGEWIDLFIDSTSGTRRTDAEYISKLESFASIEKGSIAMALKIPWTALGTKPSPGDMWLGNLFRCVGRDSDRGYLAYNPTLTHAPSFHVPERFVEIRFKNE